EFDAGLTYTRKWGNSQWRFALNAYNVADSQKSYSEASYSNLSTGGTELRRTQIYHTPRSYRFSVGVTF
ncbi:MAG: hypothetical protein ACKVI3_11420, partial [Verrucomicrobiia bacterium]